MTAKDTKPQPIVWYGAAAFALGQAIQVNNGVLHPAAVAWLAIALVLLLLALRGRSLAVLTTIPAVALMGAFVVIQWTELLVWGLRWLPRSSAPIAWFVCAMTIAAASVLLMFRWPHRAALATAMLILGHLLAGAFVIQATPRPGIDVWYFQQKSSEALLRGQNPYKVRFRNLYDADTSFYSPGMVADGWLNISCPYPPLPLLLAAPARAALGDVRWSHLLALELAAALIAIASRSSIGFWAAALLLLTPRSLLVIEVAWTDPFVILMLAFTLWCALRTPRLLWLALGLLLASKQYAALMMPLAFLLLPGRLRWREFGWLLLRALGVAVAINLPFFLWDPSSFVQNVIVLQFRLPFQTVALSFTAQLAQMTGVRIGAAAGFVAAAAALVWTTRRAPRNPAGFAGAAALVMLVFFSLNKQASCNYYFLVIACSCFAAALSARSEAVADYVGERLSRCDICGCSSADGSVGEPSTT